MLRINLFEGSHPDDVCDYCRKQTGEEVISLQLSGRRHSEMYSIQVHTKCLVSQIRRHHPASIPHLEKLGLRPRGLEESQ